ncbi:MAG: hypothetical protein QXP52_01845 [Candidatus Aenigmatarchaeota archaeon]
MKVLAVETVFIFIISMIAALVVISFFIDIKNLIINFFSEKQPKEEFEIEIIEKKSFSENLVKEFIMMCIQKSGDSKLNKKIFPCYYLKSSEPFQNINNLEIQNVRINRDNFDDSKNTMLIAYDKTNKFVYILN